MSLLPLFVYGTLLEGEERAALLAGLPRRPARVAGRLYHLPAGYPALTLARPGEGVWVHGELVSAPPPHVLSLLDRYEGVEEGLFSRVEVSAQLGSSSARAWAWVMGAPLSEGGRHIRSGRWRRTRRR